MTGCVGRAAELEWIGDALMECEPVLVVGEAGIGKTTLCLQAAAATGRPVVAVAGFRSLTWRRFGPFLAALQGAAGGAGPGSVAAALRAAVGEGVLVVDDLQWVDAGSLDVVTRLAGRLALLAAVREEDPGAAATLDAAREAGFAVLALGGLDDACAAEMARTLLPAVTEEHLATIVRGARGNPLFIEELARARDAPAGLRAALCSRIGRLGAPARHDLALLALAGRPVRRGEVGEVAPSLFSEDLAVVEGDVVDLRHALVGEVAVELLDSRERIALHGELAGLLAEDGEVARHLAAGGRRDEARRRAMRASEVAERPGDAASLLALAAMCAEGPEADELRLRAAGALLDAGDFGGVLEVTGFVEGASAEVRARTSLVRGEALWESGRGEDAEAAVSAGLVEVAGSRTPLEVRLRLEYARLIRLASSDSLRGRALAEEALVFAREVGVEEPRALVEAGLALMGSGDASGKEMLVRARADAVAVGEAAVEIYALQGLALAAMAEGRFDEAESMYSASLETCRRLGFRGRERMALAHRLWLDLFRGDYARVLEVGAALREEGPIVRNEDMALVTYGTALIDVGREQEALGIARSALATAGDRFGRERAHAVIAEAEYWGGRPARAVTVLHEGFPDGVGLKLPAFMVAPTWAWSGLELGRDVGGTDDRLVHALLLPELAREFQAIDLLREGDGGAAEAAELFASAAEGWAGRLFRAEMRCRWAQGEALRRAGSLDSAREVLEGVAERARSHGMGPLLARVRRSLRMAGGGVRTHGARAGAGLTGRERAVVELVGAGLSNEEIARRLGVASSTVARHVGKARERLGARSRIATAVAAGTAVARPLVVLSGAADEFGARCAVLEARGWIRVEGWVVSPGDPTGSGVVRTGSVSGFAATAEVVLAALRGEAIVVLVDAGEDVARALIEDLDRLGTVEHVRGQAPGASGGSVELAAEDHRLLRLLAKGHSTHEVGSALHMSPRTVRHRLAKLRQRLGVSSNAEAVLAVGTAGDSGARSGLSAAGPHVCRVRD